LNTITKAVIPVAGLGTRMLPATKAIPKEMLPIVDRPIIQYIVDECVAAGVTEIILVTHSSKNAIENHFDKSFELETTLEKRVKRQILDEIQKIAPKGVTIMHVRQGEALGLGDAVLKALPLVGEHPFMVVLPDVLISNDRLGIDLQAMVANFKRTQSSQIMVEAVSPDLVDQYGVVDCGGRENDSDSNWRINNVVEKPSIDEAPSNLAIVGRYIFTPNIWNELKGITPGVAGEIQLTDAIENLIHNEPVFAYQLQGKSHDCGSKLGYMTANVEFGLNHPALGKQFLANIHSLILQQQPCTESVAR